MGGRLASNLVFKATALCAFGTNRISAFRPTIKPSFLSEPSQCSWVGHYRRLATMAGETQTKPAESMDVCSGTLHSKADSGSGGALHSLSNLRWDNASIRNLPVDPISANHVRQVPGAVWSRVDPTPVDNPELVSFSESALGLLDVKVPEDEQQKQLLTHELALVFGGNVVPPGAQPAAHCYCGHQFGHFAGQLGDGRAISLGEIVNNKGQRWELQLKGAGLTPYSRTADGRAVLRSSILHALGIPTTRAATLVTSDTEVIRDPLYDGHPIKEKASVVLRLAPSFLRLGSWEIFKHMDAGTGRSGPSADPKYHPIGRQLLDHVISYHYPHLLQKHEVTEDRYVAFFEELTVRTAKMVAEWQCVGFVHGVLNTDNLSALGLTIDYGPFGFVDHFDSTFVPNHSDDGGRYSYKNQPKICKWNLERFAEALSTCEAAPLERLQAAIQTYDTAFAAHYGSKMRRKLGFVRVRQQTDPELVGALLATMEETAADFTNTFRLLSALPVSSPTDRTKHVTELVNKILDQCAGAHLLAKMMQPSFPKDQLDKIMSLGEDNSLMIQMFTGRPYSYFKKQAELYERSKDLQSMDDDTKREIDRAKWTQWVERYSDRLWAEVGEGEIDQADLDALNNERVLVMNANNPKYILRNYLAQNAIAKAEQGDFSEVNQLFTALMDPYGENDTAVTCGYDSKAPEWASKICVSCSS